MPPKFFTQLSDLLKGATGKKTDLSTPRPQSSIGLKSPEPAPSPKGATPKSSDATVPPRPKSSLGFRLLESTPFRNEDAERAAPTIQPSAGFGSSESAPLPKEDAGRIDASQPPRPRSSLGFTSSEPASSAPQRQESDGGATSEVSSIPGFHLPDTDVDADEGEPSSGYVVDPTAACEIKSDLKSPLYSTAGTAIDVLKESSDACTPLKAVVGALSAFLKYDDRTVIPNRKTIELLIPRLQGLAKSLSAPVPKGEIRERERRVILRQILEKVLQDLKPLEERLKVTIFPNNVSDAETLTGLAEDIRDAMMEYQTAPQQDIWRMNNELIDGVDLSLLKGMRHTAEAEFLAGGRQGCIRGTRRDVLYQIEKWLMDMTGQRVFFLNGLAGTGKSAIAQTFAEIGFADGKLDASFFCSRYFEDRSNLQAIFPTLAFQLAHRYPLFRQQLLQVLRVNHDVGRESLNSQLDKLIVRPLKGTRISTLIIIDALDECRDEQPASALLSVLSRYVHEMPGVKFFITGRPEPRIRQGFRLELLFPITEVLKLHSLERSSVDEDIRLYLKTRLTDIRNTRRDCDFPEEWPNSHDIDGLCKEAAGYFVYASTVVKFVASDLHAPKDRLDQMILLSHAAHTAAYGGIYPLYTEILKLGFQGEPYDEGLYSRFRSVVGTILLVFQPLSSSALSDLVESRGESARILTTLRSLHSLIHVPDNNLDTIRAFHKSFPDFITDSGRCTDIRFFIEPSLQHTDILFSCLKLMEARLEKNICRLDDYAVLSEVKDLPPRREVYIGSSLEYACRFWTRHLAKVPCCGGHIKEILRATDEFLTTRLLCWIEVLSITGHLGGAVYAIDEVRQWQISAGASACRQADDSERFILENFDVIHDSPSHIYHTALPLSPSSSWLRDCYKNEFAQEARVLMGLPNKWDACFRTISIENQPSAFAYSGDIIAVGSESQTVVLLESITGGTTSVLSGHEDTVTSLSFSPDGTSFVSGSDDKSIKLWDIQTGGVIETFSYTSAITSVSISPDGTTIASGAWDGTICLWDIWARTLRSSMRHDYEVTAVSFSPTNSRRLLSSSADKTVRQWDVDGRRTKAPQVYYEAIAVAHAAYTSDGAHFASCGGAIATVRHSETGAVVAKLSAPNQKTQFRCCCLSSDGRFVACAAGDLIYVWDVADSGVRLAAELISHSQNIIAMAFSLSSFSLTSGSKHGFVKVWDMSSLLSDSTTTEGIPAPIDSAPIESVKLFAEDSTVVTSDMFGLVRTWDLVTGKCKGSFPTPAEGIRDTHLTGDTLVIVWWASEGREYHIWDVGKGQPPRKLPSSFDELIDLKISGDGTKIFGLGDRFIEARSVQTGENVGRVRRKGNSGGDGSLVVDGSRVWLEGSFDMGWDFGNGGASTFSPRETLGRLRLTSTDRSAQRSIQPAWMEDTVTGRRVFHLPGRYMTSDTRNQWNGRYLVVWSPSGVVVIIDFGNLFS